MLASPPPSLCEPHVAWEVPAGRIDSQGTQFYPQASGPTPLYLYKLMPCKDI